MTDKQSEEDRLQNLLKEIPFLESLKDPNIIKIVKVLKDENRRKLVGHDRIIKIERLVMKNKIKEEPNIISKTLDEIKNINDASIVECIELNSSDDEDLIEKKDKCNSKKEESSDEEIEFYQINNPTEKMQPPNPTKNEKNIKSEKNETLTSDDSDLEIIDCDLDNTKMKNNDKKMEVTELKKEVIEKEEKILFTRRNDNSKVSENTEIEKTIEQPKENGAKCVTKTIDLLESDEETSPSNLESILLNDNNKEVLETNDKNINKNNKYENLKTSTNEKNELLSNKSLSELEEIGLSLESQLFGQKKEQSSLELTSKIDIVPVQKRDPRFNFQLNNSNNIQIIPQSIISSQLNSANLVAISSPISNFNAIANPLCNTIAFSNNILTVPVPVPLQPILNPPTPQIQVPLNVNSFAGSSLVTNSSLITNSRITPSTINQPLYPSHCIRSIIPPAPPYSKNDIISALEESNFIKKKQDSASKNNPTNTLSQKESNSKHKFTVSKLTYGEHLRKKNEEKLRAEKEAYERGIRTAESLGYVVPHHKELNKDIEETKNAPYSKYSKDKLGQTTVFLDNNQTICHEKSKTKSKSLLRDERLPNENKNIEVISSTNKKNVRKSIEDITKSIVLNSGDEKKNKKEVNKEICKRSKILKKRRSTSDLKPMDIKQSTVTKTGRIRGLTDSSSEDETDKQNNLNQADKTKSSEVFVKVIEVLRENLQDSFSKNLLLKIDDIINSINKAKINENLEDSVNIISEKTKNITEQKKKDVPKTKQIKKSVSRKSTSKPPTSPSSCHLRNSLNRELKTLHEHIDNFYDRDEILASAGTHRASSKLALKKIKKKSNKIFYSDDESSKNTNKSTASLTKVFKKTRRKSFYIERNKYKGNNYDGDDDNENDKDDNNDNYISSQLKKTLINNNIVDFNSNLKEFTSNEDANDGNETDDFSSHIQEKWVYLKRNKKLFSLKNECRVKLKKLKPEDINREKLRSKMPILKPLSTVPDLRIEQKKIISNLKNVNHFNINLHHHCHNEMFMKKCIICYKPFQDVVSHYVHSHTNNPNHEVYCARLPYLIIEKYKKNPVIGELVQRKPYKFNVKCIFCDFNITGFHTELNEHYATHTGEYAWECDQCEKKLASKKEMVSHCKTSCKKNGKPTRIYSYKKESQITATFCAECQYIQLNKANVTRHLQKHHQITREPERLCENLVLVKFFEESPTSESIEQSNLSKSLDQFFAKQLPNVSAEKCKDKANIKQEINESILINNEADLSSININNDQLDMSLEVASKSNDLDIKPMTFDDFDEIFSASALISEQSIFCEEDAIDIKREEISISNNETDYVEMYNQDNEIIYIDSDDQETNINNEEETELLTNQTIASSSSFEKQRKPVSNTLKDETLNIKKLSLLKPWIDNQLDENIDNSKSILSDINLSNFYKCMTCSFSTNVEFEMLSHLKKHRLDNLLQNPDLRFSFECCYCAISMKDPAELVKHTKIEHNNCNFQCSKCFYRSCSSYSVKLHIKMFHKKIGKIIVCGVSENLISEELQIILQSREKNIKPFECHLCSCQNYKYYLKNDFENHFKTNHPNAIFCKCDNHGIICCLFCNFETNSLDKIKIHMTNLHPNREQYVTARFRNPKLKKQMDSSTPNSTVIVFLSEILPEKYFMPSITLKDSLKKIYVKKKNFKISAANAGETLWNVKYLSNELEKYNNSKSDDYLIETENSIDTFQQEMYEMAKIAVHQTGFVGKDLYKCLVTSCKINLENFEEWTHHLATQHSIMLTESRKCPHCNELHHVKDFINHFNNKHLLHKYFCYLCATTECTAAVLERHLQLIHRVVMVRNKSMFPDDKRFPVQFITVVPNGIFCDNKSLTLHMRNILKASRYHLKVKNLNQTSITTERIIDKSSLKLPKYVAVENQRYGCCEKKCQFVAQNENLLEDHIKNIHRSFKSFECRHCSFIIAEEIQNFDRIKDHLRMHAEILFVCTKCPFYDHQRQIVQKHIRSVHKLQMNMTKIIRNREDQFNCEICLEEGCILVSLSSCLICETILFQPENIIEHLKCKHFVTILYECQYCKISYLKLDNLIEHIAKDHQKVLKVICKFEYKSSHENSITDIEVEKAKDTSDPLVTSKNNKRSRPNNEMTEINQTDDPQIKKFKTDLSSQLLDKTVVQVYVCEDCNFEALTQSNLIIHKKHKHKTKLNLLISASLDSDVTNEYLNDEIIRCDYCKFSCNTLEDLKQHRFISNHDKGQMTYRCDICSNEFHNLIELKQHNLLVHKELLSNTPLPVTTDVASERLKMYRCEFCKFSSISLDLIKEHKLYDHKMKDLQKNIIEEKIQKHVQDDDVIIIEDNTNHCNDNALDISPNKSLNLLKNVNPPSSIRVKPIASLLDPSLMVMIPNSNLNDTEKESSQKNVLNTNKEETTSKVMPNLTSLLSTAKFENLSLTTAASTSKNTSTTVQANIKELLNNNSSLDMTKVIVPKVDTFELENGIMYKCYYCQFKEKTIISLLKHWERNHSRNRLFQYTVLFILQCIKCNKKGSFSDLKNHFLKSHPNDDIVLKRPVYNSKKIICSECSTEFKTVADLKKHNKIQHSNLLSQIKSESENISQNLFDIVKELGYQLMLIKCNACGEEFTNQNICQQHFVENHQNVNIMFSPIRFYREHLIIFCQICQFKSNNLRNAIVHFRAVHTNPFICIYCNKYFSKLDFLKEHYSMHHNMSNEPSFNINRIKSQYEMYATNLIWSFANGFVATTLELKNTKPAWKELVLAIMNEIEYSELLLIN